MYWLRDLLVRGRVVEAWRGIAREIAATTADRGAGWPTLRSAATRTLGWRGRRPRPPLWLTASARRHLGELDGSHHAAPGWLRRDQIHGLLDPRGAQATSLEVSNASRFGIDVRRPYRDRRLIEFALTAPAHLLHRPRWDKWILRQAMVGILPEEVRLRRNPSWLTPLCARGLIEEEQETVRELLYGEKATWQEWVRPEWLRTSLATAPMVDSVDAVAVWHCICWELWRRGFEAEPEGDASGKTG
jgi:asparagine synthase (glutamine-hydrolysing)